MSGLWLVSYVGLWLLFLIVAVVLVSVLRNLGDLAETLKNSNRPRDTITLVVGQTTPILVFQTLDGTTLSTSDLQGQPTTYAVVSPSCGPCQMLFETLMNGAALAVFPDRVRRVIISTGSSAETWASLEAKLPADVLVLLDTDNQAAESWGARSTPTFVSLDAEGRYQKHTVGFEPPPSKIRQHKHQSEVQPQLH